MEPLIRLTAVAVPYDEVNVDTDQIVPARFLKYERDQGYGRFLFHDRRFQGDGTANPDFVLNRPEYGDARVLVANHNFGCGSSREGAVYALADFGFRCVIAPSFGDIFHNNCLKNGVLPVRLGEEATAALRAKLAANPGSALTVDLEAGTVSEPDGTVHRFPVDPFWRRVLLEGLDEMGMTLASLPAIEAFERSYYEEFTWLAIKSRDRNA